MDLPFPSGFSGNHPTFRGATAPPTSPVNGDRSEQTVTTQAGAETTQMGHVSVNIDIFKIATGCHTQRISHTKGTGGVYVGESHFSGVLLAHVKWGFCYVGNLPAASEAASLQVSAPLGPAHPQPSPVPGTERHFLTPHSCESFYWDMCGFFTPGNGDIQCPELMQTPQIKPSPHFRCPS